jgi:hypothetical protein
MTIIVKANIAIILKDCLLFINIDLRLRKYIGFGKLPNREIRIINNDEKWNEYNIQNNKLKIKLVISEIRRVTNRYDHNGYPYYIIIGGPAVTLS